IRDKLVTGVQTCALPIFGFSGSISNITAITMHIVAAVDSTDPNAAGTAQMIFYNNGAVAGTGGVKTLTSTYTEYVSGVFNTSIRSEERRVGKERRQQSVK